MKLAVFIITVLSGFLTMSASATVIHVPTDYPAIQQAINASSNGDIVLVADGIYIENINFGGKAVTVTSENGPTSTIIHIQTSGQPVITFGNGEGLNSILSGFTVEGDSSYWGIHVQGASPFIYNNIIKKHEIGVRVDVGGPMIRKNEITLCSHSNIAPRNGGAIRLEQSNGAIIDSNRIHHNYSDVGGAGFIYNSSNILIRRNLIYSDSSIYIGGLNIDANTNVTILNNTIVDHHYTSVLIGTITLSNNNTVVISNNIIAFNNEYGIYNHSSNTNVSASYNDLYFNSPANYHNLSPGTGSITQNPEFVYLGIDFRLAPDSPCINTGNPAMPLDPDGSISDMGALYFDDSYVGYGSVIGTVTDPNGEPVQNVLAIISSIGRWDVTDSNGEYSIDSLETWRGYDIFFMRSAYIDTTILGVLVGRDDTTTLDIVMYPYGALSGVVTDGALNPIENALVGVVGAGISDLTDASGEYFLYNIHPGTYNILFEHQDHIDVTVEDFNVIGGDTTILDQTMQECS